MGEVMIMEPNYPTCSLDFLKMLQGTERSTEPRQSAVHLRALISGAGVGGLATAIALARRGHEVTVFEQAQQLAEVGAGIQVPPNSLRMLLGWGLGDFLDARFTEPNGVFWRRWQNGEVIADTRYGPNFLERYGAPYYVVHRAHLHDALHRLAIQYGVVVQLASKVASIDADAGLLSLADGTLHQGDLIVAADGVHSSVRKTIFGGATQPSKTGFVCYRCAIDAEEMKQDPDTAWLLDEPNLNLWVGPGGHIMTYTIAGGKTFNVVVNRADSTDPSTWNQNTALQDMRAQIRDWDPRIQKVVSIVKRTLKWPIYGVPTLQTWVRSKAVILGDAAHAMLPYMSQGAAIAVEDAAALAEAIHLINAVEEMPDALRSWESIRRLRASQMQQASELNSVLWHFPDGPEQRARDASMRPEVEGRSFVSSANQWSDPTTQRWTYGYDAEGEVRNAWEARREKEEVVGDGDSAYASRPGSAASDD